MWLAFLIVLVLSPDASPADDSAARRQEAVIERAPVMLRAPETYQVPIALEPVRTLQITSQVDGVVASIQTQLGAMVAAQAEAVRLDAHERNLQWERAQAALREAEARKKAAEVTGDVFAIEAATAAVDVARIDRDLAQFRRDQTIIRFPFEGQVTAIHVSPGEYVRVGDPLITVIDASSLIVELPAERSQVAPGQTLSLTVEQSNVSGRIEVLLPLAERFGPLRDLVPSITSVRVMIDNGARSLAPGQTVYSDLIPRHPVTEIETRAIQNTDDGGRKVQVIREGFVRDVPVDLLGQIGDTYVFVAGRFSPQDEIVLSSSIPLLDGTPVKPKTAEQAETRPRSRGLDSDDF